MRAFLRRYLDPVGFLGEALFGLVMALGFTASVRLGLAEPDNRELFIGIAGCNLAWAIVDGVMYALMELFERGRRARLVREVRAAQSEEDALQRIGAEFELRLGLELNAQDRQQAARFLLGVVRSAEPEPPRLTREDVLGGVAAGLVIVLATLPVVVPYLVIEDPALAVRASNAVALALLFALGTAWGRVVGGSALRTGAGLTTIGAVLVLITIALGG